MKVSAAHVQFFSGIVQLSSSVADRFHDFFDCGLEFGDEAEVFFVSLHFLSERVIF